MLVTSGFLTGRALRCKSFPLGGSELDEVASVADFETADRHQWLDRAACIGIDVDVFFPLGQETRSSSKDSQAKQICTTCPVLPACRDWSLDVAPEFGIFGGLTPEERRRIHIRRRRATLTPS